MQMFYKGKDKNASKQKPEPDASVLTGNLGMFACFERVEQKNGKIKKDEKQFFVKPNKAVIGQIEQVTKVQFKQMRKQRLIETEMTINQKEVKKQKQDKALEQM